MPIQIPQRSTRALLFALLLAAGTAAAQTAPPDAVGTPTASATVTAPATVAPPPDPAMAPKPDRSFAEAWEASEPWRTDRFYFETSLYTKHFSSNPNHDNHQQLILGEWNITENWLVGGSFFNNSFGQPSEFFYGGYRFRPFEQAQQLYFKVAAGVIHGYKPPYQNKIPFNSTGYAPGIVPSVGYCINRFCSELVLFGTAGMLLTAGVTVP